MSSAAKKSFSRRLTLNILLVTSIIFLIASLAAALSSHMLIAGEARNTVTNKLESVTLGIEKILSNVEAAATQAAWMADENKEDTAFIYHLTRKVVEENENVIGCAVAYAPEFFPGVRYMMPFTYADTKTGEIITLQQGGNDYDYLYMDWYQIPVLLKKPCWSEPYSDDPANGQQILTYSFPLIDSSEVVYAVVTADISIDWLSGLISSIKPYENSYTVLASRSATYVAGPDNGDNSYIGGATLFSETLTNGDETAYQLCMDMIEGRSGVKEYARKGKYSQLSFVAYGPLDNGWSAAIFCRYRDVLEKAAVMHSIIILISLLSLAFLSLVCYFLIRRMTRPLTEFTLTARSIAEGDFNTPLPEIKSEDEIRDLKDSFDYMQHALNSYIRELTAKTAANERFESELNIARSIQQHMVPTVFPVEAKYEVNALLQPAKEVGGDFYDFFEKNGYLYFAVGDVSGKGVPAALFMAIVRASVRFVCGTGIGMDEVVSEINNSVCEGNDSNMFVTLFIGKLELATGHLEYCNAGHNPIVVVSPDGGARFLKAKPNLAAGLFSDFPYEREDIYLKKGSRLLLYTDGVTEAENHGNDQYGNDRLLEWSSRRLSALTPEEAVSDLLNDLGKFTEGAEQNDDITIMTINYKGL